MYATGTQELRGVLLGEVAFKPDVEWGRISIGRHTRSNSGVLVKKRGRAKARRQGMWDIFGEMLHCLV